MNKVWTGQLYSTTTRTVHTGASASRPRCDQQRNQRPRSRPTRWPTHRRRSQSTLIVNDRCYAI